MQDDVAGGFVDGLDEVIDRAAPGAEIGGGLPDEGSDAGEGLDVSRQKRV